MKKTSTRLAAIGGLVVVGACAIGLAQHDARKRLREPIKPQSFAPEAAEPIQPPGEWSPPDFDNPGRIVRANNGSSSPGQTDARGNPLRGALGPSAPSQPGGLEAELQSDFPTIRSPQPVGFANFQSENGSEGTQTQLVAGQAPVEKPPWLAGANNGQGSSSRSTGNLPSTGELPGPGGLRHPTSNTPSTDPSTGRASLPGAMPPTSPPRNSAVGAGSGLPTLPAQGHGNQNQTNQGQGSRIPNNLPGPGLPSSSLPGPGLPGPGLPPTGSPVQGDRALRGASASQSGLPSLPATSTPRTNTSLQPTSTGASRSIGDMSDTQRGIMRPTDLVGQHGAPSAPSQGVSGQLSAPGVSRGPLPSARSSAPDAQRQLGSGQTLGQQSAGRDVSQMPMATIPSLSAGNSNVGSGNAGSSSTAFPGQAGNRSTISPSRVPEGTANGSIGSGFGPRTGASGPQIGAASTSSASYANASRGTPASLTALASNQPGNRYLDGSQNPVMQIQKRAPDEIQVGKPATFVIAVRNSGNSPAHNVTVVDKVPRGARLVEAVPSVTPTADGTLSWNLGEIAAGDERTITLQIIPEVQGEVGSVASVHFTAQASVRTIATMPKLELSLDSQPNTLIGDPQQIHVTIENTGTGVARGVRLEADLPAQVRHESGDAQLEAMLGDLRPNEKKRVTLACSAIQPGKAECRVRAVSDDGVQSEQVMAIDVRAPQLAATIVGPKRRYLERQATYRIIVNNTGTAVASNLDFTIHLPAGLKFNSANNRGSYDPATHSVTWGLYELPAGAPAEVELVVMPVELGSQVIAFNAKGDLNIAAEAKSQLTVDGLAELAFTIGQDNGTIEVGASTTYSVQITNIGNKADTQVQLAVELPNGAELLAVDAPGVKWQVQGRQLAFAPIAEMRSKDQFTYRFQVRHSQPGSQIVRTKLTSANWPVAVVKEEGTLVYNDQN